ncbi:MAG: TetR/AcrR family transcriptional regulator [Flavobacteriaceae bacterium]
MKTKEYLIQVAKENFVTFGSKHITMDELALLLGISKKTIYTHFSSKEALVIESIKKLVSEFNADIAPILSSDKEALDKIIAIYEVVFDYISKFKPSFVFGLKKYYPEAYSVYKKSTEKIVFTEVLVLLEEAKNKGRIHKNANLILFSKLYLYGLENRLFNADSLFETYSKEELLEYMIINNLNSITTVKDH